MPILQVLRHAQAQPFAARDHDRELTAEGAASARAVGRALAVAGVPERSLVSTARRARQTLELAMDAGGWRTDVVELAALYGGGPDEVLEALAAEAGDDPVLIVGHEPWSSGLVGLLTGAQVTMTTATLAVMQVGPAWDALDPAWCTLTSLLPARLAAHAVGSGR